MKRDRTLGHLILLLAAVAAAVVLTPAERAWAGQTITAHVVVLDNPTVFNRLGAQNPNWITYALKRDVIHKAGAKAGQVCQLPNGTDNGCQPGNVELRPDKRTRPLVVRSVAGAQLNVVFTNLLAPIANPYNAIQDGLINNDQVADRCAGFHASGTEVVTSLNDDGSFVGKNNPGAGVGACGAGAVKGGLVGPGASINYNLYPPHEGAFVISSYGATIGSEGNAGNLGIGM